MKKSFVVFACLIIFLFISSPAEAVKYSFELKTEPYSEKSWGLAYIDSNITVENRWAKRGSDYIGINMIFSNRSDSPIKVYWNESAMVGADNITYRPGISGIPYMELKKGAALPVSVLPPGTSSTTMIFPIDAVEYAGGWTHKYILPRTYNNAIKYVGSGWKVFIPIEIKQEKKNFTFSLMVSEVSKE